MAPELVNANVDIKFPYAFLNMLVVLPLWPHHSTFPALNDGRSAPAGAEEAAVMKGEKTVKQEDLLTPITLLKFEFPSKPGALLKPGTLSNPRTLLKPRTLSTRSSDSGASAASTLDGQQMADITNHTGLGIPTKSPSSSHSGSSISLKSKRSERSAPYERGKFPWNHYSKDDRLPQQVELRPEFNKGNS